jgi:enoyl-CoA hydratase/carnithine racemase
VLSSTGKHFCAGLDGRALSGLDFEREDLEIGRRRASFRSVVRGFQDAISSLARIRIPVLAAVQGACVGGGLDLVTAALARVMEVAATIAEKSPLAVWGTKELLNYSRDHTVEDGLERTALWQAGMRQGTDSVESWRAFKAKRRPEYDPLIPE